MATDCQRQISDYADQNFIIEIYHRFYLCIDYIKTILVKKEENKFRLATDCQRQISDCADQDLIKQLRLQKNFFLIKKDANKCSDKRLKCYLPFLLVNYDRPTDQTANQQTNMEVHRAPIIAHNIALFLDYRKKISRQCN